MARLTLMENENGKLYLVGVLRKTFTFNTPNNVMFIDEDGFLTYGTEEYLAQYFKTVSKEYKFAVRRETFKVK